MGMAWNGDRATADAGNTLQALFPRLLDAAGATARRARSRGVPGGGAPGDGLAGGKADIPIQSPAHANPPQTHPSPS